MYGDALLAKKIYQNDDNCLGCRLLKWIVKREIEKDNN